MKKVIISILLLFFTIMIKLHRNIQPAWHTWEKKSDGTIVEDYSQDYDIFKYVH